jgi:hypothetical protein
MSDAGTELNRTLLRVDELIFILRQLEDPGVGFDTLGECRSTLNRELNLLRVLDPAARIGKIAGIAKQEDSSPGGKGNASDSSQQDEPDGFV